LAVNVDGVGSNPVGIQDSSTVPAPMGTGDNTQADICIERDNVNADSKRKEKAKQVERKRKASVLTHASASESIGRSSRETLDSPILMNQLPRALPQVVESIQKSYSRQTRSTR
jgi:hypothetical protein